MSTNDFQVVEVTSIAEAEVWGTNEVWISVPRSKDWPKGRRQKVYADSIFPCGEKNDAVMVEITKVTKRMAVLDGEYDAARKKLTCYVIPEEK